MAHVCGSCVWLRLVLVVFPIPLSVWGPCAGILFEKRRNVLETTAKPLRVDEEGMEIEGCDQQGSCITTLLD